MKVEKIIYREYLQRDEIQGPPSHSRHLQKPSSISIASFWRKENYSVETVSNLKEACRKLSVDHYAAVITEFLPPFEETFSMIRSIKERSPETYVMIMTKATIDEKTYGELIDVGVDDLILKPDSFKKF